MASSGGKKGSKKIGRLSRSPAHARYVGTDRRRFNKIRKLKKHLKKQFSDRVAANTLVKLEKGR